MPRPARVSDESLNSYGFWVKSKGVKTDKYTGLFLWNHLRAWRGTKDEVLPIGKINGLKLKNNEWHIESPEFDDGDTFAAELARKYEKGYLNAFSIGIVPLKFSDAQEDLKPGQTRMTIVECELVEISLCDIPSNRNAVALYEYDNEGNLVPLSEGADPNVPLLTTLSQTTNKEKMEVNFTQVALSLGLSDASETAIIAKIKDLQAQVNRVNTLTAELQVYKDKELNERKAAVETLLSDAVKAKKITEAQKPNWVTLFDNNFDATKALLESMQPMQRLADVPNTTSVPGAGGVQTHNGKTFSQLSREDPTELQRLKEEQPEVFKNLFKSEFKKEYRETVR